MSLVIERYRDGDLAEALEVADATLDAIERHGVVPWLKDTLAVDAVNQRGFLRLVLGDTDRAAVDFRTANERRPSWLFAWNLGVALVESGSREGALQALSDARDLAMRSRGPVFAYMVGWTPAGRVMFQLRAPTAATLAPEIEGQIRLVQTDQTLPDALSELARDPQLADTALVAAAYALAEPAGT
jgi:hypothetical protein